ncbi:MAG: hypothetical protein WKF78_04325 [Candidatus Limnocylindrales bacterium]
MSNGSAVQAARYRPSHVHRLAHRHAFHQACHPGQGGILSMGGVALLPNRLAPVAQLLDLAFLRADDLVRQRLQLGMGRPPLRDLGHLDGRLSGAAPSCR